MASSATTDRTIVTRRPSFGPTFAELDRHFAADADVVMSHAIAVLSAVFPDGEDYFVRTVRAVRDEITDPDLLRKVAGFIGQEALHGREHRALNDRLAELGYPTKRIERFVRWGLGTRERLLPSHANLASTAALEHITATIAEVILRDDEARRLVGSPEVLDLLLWHAVEECEHKAVAFDVYRAVGGSERTRVLVMNATLAGFIVGMTLQLLGSLVRDPAVRERGRLVESARRFLGSPFLRRSTWRRFLDYNRHDFHPDDHDTDALLAGWREELFGADGRLNDKLTSAA